MSWMPATLQAQIASRDALQSNIFQERKLIDKKTYAIVGVSVLVAGTIIFFVYKSKQKKK